LVDFILQSDIVSEQKLKLSLLLSKKIIELKKEVVIEPVAVETSKFDEIDSFEADLISTKEEIEQIDSEQNISQYRSQLIEIADAKYLQYKSFISDSIFGNPDDVYGIFTLDDLLDTELSLDKFSIMLILSVYSIKDINIPDDEITEYVDVLNNIDEMYKHVVRQNEIANEEIITRENNKKVIELYEKKIADCYFELENIFKVSSSMFSAIEPSFYDTLTNLQQKIANVKIQIEYLKIDTSNDLESVKKNIEDIVSQIEKVNNYLNSKQGEKDEASKVTKIKTFILFDVDDYSKKTFLYEDLLGDNPFIEPQAIVGNYVSNEDVNYQQNISKLISDLMLYGKCEYMLSVNTSTENYADKIEGIIYKKDKNGRVLRDEKTPLWRIRPTPTSNIRFIERKVLIPKDSELFSQVRSIIQKHLPKVEISEDEDFVMMVNLGCGIKRADEDLYNTAYRRFSDRVVNPLALFYEDGNYGKHYNKATKLKNKLSAEECELLEAYVVSSLQSLYEMGKEDSLYDFSFIDRMGGAKTYGI